MIVLPPLMFALAIQGNVPAVALLLDMQGKGKVVGPTLEEPMALLMEFPQGRTLRLEPGARAVWVTLKGGEEITVKGPAVFKLDANGVPVGLKSGVQRKAAAGLKLQGALKPGGLAQASLVMRGTPEDFTLTSPASPVVLNLDAFAWESQGEGATFKLTVREEGGPIALERTTKELRVAVPSGALAPGRTYAWKVLCQAADGNLTESNGRVGLLSPERRAVLKAARPAAGADFSTRVLYAALLEQYQLLDLAKLEWKRLAQERKEDEVLAAFAE